MGVPKPTGDGANIRKKNIIIKASKGAAEENGGGGGTPNNPNQMLIYVPPHPLLKHWLAVARNAASPSALFRSAIAKVEKILMYELSRDWLETYERESRPSGGGERGSGGPVESDIDRSSAESRVNAGR